MIRSDYARCGKEVGACRGLRGACVHVAPQSRNLTDDSWTAGKYDYDQMMDLVPQAWEVGVTIPS